MHTSKWHQTETTQFHSKANTTKPSSGNTGQHTRRELVALKPEQLLRHHKLKMSSKFKFKLVSKQTFNFTRRRNNLLSVSSSTSEPRGRSALLTAAQPGEVRVHTPQRAPAPATPTDQVEDRHKFLTDYCRPKAVYRMSATIMPDWFSGHRKKSCTTGLSRLNLS